jgi:ABC-2 type transporter
MYVLFHRYKQQDLLNSMGALYAATMLLGVQNSTSVMPVVSIERTVFYRERAAGMYSASPYAFAQVYSEKILIFHLQHFFLLNVISM